MPQPLPATRRGEAAPRRTLPPRLTTFSVPTGTPGSSRTGNFTVDPGLLPLRTARPAQPRAAGFRAPPWHSGFIFISVWLSPHPTTSFQDHRRLGPSSTSLPAPTPITPKEARLTRCEAPAGVDRPSPGSCGQLSRSRVGGYDWVREPRTVGRCEVVGH